MKKVIIGLSLLLTSIIIGTVYIFHQSIAPFDEVENETIAFVRERTDLNQVDEFYWYNGSETYLTIIGSTEDEEEMVYIVSQIGGRITSISAEETITEQEAIQITRENREPNKVLNARIGMMGDTPVWEVSYRNENDRLGYYILNLNTGEWLRTIDNI